MQVRYLTHEEAIKEMKWRRNDPDLASRITEIFRAHGVEENPLDGFDCFLLRHLASARLEELQFATLCKEFGLKGVIGTYPDDKFVPENPSKRRLALIRILYGFGRKSGPQIKSYKIVDINRWKGMPIREIKTFSGRPLMEFHDACLQVMGEKFDVPPILGLSAWVRQIGSAKHYYPLLALAAVRAMWFESFETPGFPNLDKFTREIVIPALKSLRQWNLPDPLIVYHPTLGWRGFPNDENLIMNCYPPEVEEIVKQFI